MINYCTYVYYIRDILSYLLADASKFYLTRKKRRKKEVYFKINSSHLLFDFVPCILY